MPDTVATSAAVSTETTTTPSESTVASNPISTSSIAERVVARMDSESNDDTTVVEKKPEAKTEKKTEVDEDDFDAVPAETVDATGKKKVNSIPHPRVQKMIARREKKLIAGIAKELGITKAEAELKLEDITGHITESKTKYSGYESELEESRQIEAIMQNEPERLIRMLATANPEGYGRFAKVLEQVAERVEKQQTQGADDGDDPEPQPDYDMGNGQMTFSAEGFKKLRAWERRQGKREAQALIDERLTPIEKERQERQKQERVQHVHRQAQAAVDRAIDAASKWPQFNENQEAIAEAINKNPRLTLHDAYMQVVLPKLQGDRTKMRQELLDEINKTPHSSSATTTPAVVKPEPGGKKTTADYARKNVERLSA